MVSEHEVTFEELADWVDGRLEPAARQRVDAHLATGCPSCQGDLAWLRRFQEAGRVEGYVQPPARLVAGAKASYRLRRARPCLRTWLPHARRLAPALGAAFLVLAFALYLVRTPTVFARSASVASAPRSLEASTAEGLAWRPLGSGDVLGEGQRIRAAGEATVVLFDGSTLCMQPGAEVALSSLRSGLLGIARRVVLQQTAGTVRYDVPPMPRDLASLHVQSPTTTVAVQGTSFVVSVGPGGETSVEVLAGTVAVAGSLDSTMLAAGEAASIEAGGPVRLRATAVATPGATQEQSSAAPSATRMPRAAPHRPGGPTVVGTAAPQPTAGPSGPRPTQTSTAGGEGPGRLGTPGPGATGSPRAGPGG